MSDISATVAIPVRNGGPLFRRVLVALSRQTVEHELLICDSASSDGSAQAARASGARVIEIAQEEFGHGRTRNLLMAQASGSRVALLTQDAEPADEHWLEQLLRGFGLGEDIALVYGPYRPRAGAPLAVRIELDAWFRSLSPDGTPQVERLQPGAFDVLDLLGRRGYFTDANACISRAAWERVPFREIPYAEDRALALDMLRAGYAKAFAPDAAVVHSHTYTQTEQLRRCFDEWRGLREVYGWREPASPGRLLGQLRGELGRARSYLLAGEGSSRAVGLQLAGIAARYAVCRLGALLGSRADMMPAPVRRRLSLEGRAGFSPSVGVAPRTESSEGSLRR